MPEVTNQIVPTAQTNQTQPQTNQVVTTNNDFLNYASKSNVNAAFNPELGRLTINGIPVDINQSGLTYQNGQLTGTQDQYDALLSPFINIGAKTVDAYREMEQYQAYETPEEYRNLMLQIIARANEKYQYNFDEDPSVQAAREELSKSMAGLAAQHGFLYSGGTQNIIEAQLKTLTPQFEEAAYSRYKADFDMNLNFLNTLMKWDQIQYERSLSNLSLIQMKSDFILSLAENEYKSFKLMLDQHRTEQQIKLAQESYELDKLKQDTENAFNRIDQLGYVDNQSASILGIPVGTKARWVQQLAMEHQNKLDQMAQENKYNVAMAQLQADLEKDVMEYKEEISVATKLKLMEQEYTYKASLAELEYKYKKELADIAAAEAAKEAAAKEAAAASEKATKEAYESQFITVDYSALKKQFTTQFVDKSGNLITSKRQAAAKWVKEQFDRGVKPDILDKLINTYGIPEYNAYTVKGTYEETIKKMPSVYNATQKGR